MDLEPFHQEVLDQLDPGDWRTSKTIRERLYRARRRDPKRRFLRFLLVTGFIWFAEFLYTPSHAKTYRALAQLNKETLASWQGGREALWRRLAPTRSRA